MSGLVDTPPGWRKVPIGRLFRRREIRGRSDLPLLSVYRDWGVVQRIGREDNFNKPGEDLDTYKHVQHGDLVLNKMKTWQGSLGVSSHEGIVSPAYFVAKPVAPLVPRFIHHLLRSQPLIAEYGARSKGIRPSQWDLPWEEFARIVIALPTERGQRAIADFLDAETARIDALITKKRHLFQMLREHLAAHIECVVWREVRNTTPLMYLTPSDRQIMYGIVLPGPDVEDGIPIVKGGNVASGRLQPHELARTTREIEANYARARIAGGDILYAIRGGIGDVAIAPSNIAGANITQDVARVAPRPDVDSRWVRYSLESATARADALARVVGATVKGINIRDLKRIRVPALDPAEMKTRADELDEIERSTIEIRQRLNRQINLLAEHRQALITAAVTGEIGVPGATVT